MAIEALIMQTCILKAIFELLQRSAGEDRWSWQTFSEPDWQFGQYYYAYK